MADLPTIPLRAGTLPMADEVLAIVRELRAALIVPPERRLWGLAEIADYSGYSQSSVSQKIACRTDFPDAVRVAADAHPRWPAGEVMAWFESRRRRRDRPASPRRKTEVQHG